MKIALFADAGQLLDYVGPTRGLPAQARLAKH